MNFKSKTFLLALSLCALSHGTTVAQQLAFPEAQGWGRYAKGARGVSSPKVYHVTNLNDSGTGSLRDAVSQSGRIVVFDVSGVIKISSRIVFASNIYVAGQTAPGEGITVYGDGVSFSGSTNIICRYLRVRMGHDGSSGKDCAGISNGTNMIFDHCSFSWGLDETFSINPDGKGDIGDITIQNTIIGQGLMTHSAGGLIQADNITLYRNLYCDNSTRNNKVKGINQFANNIVYNWKNGAYIMGGDSEGTSYVNIQSNLFINGPSGGGDAFTGANADFHCYADDNWQDRNTDGVYNPTLVTSYSAATRETTPYPYPELDLWNGKELIEKSLPEVGASLPYRDQSDCYMIDEVMSFGKKGNLITYETALPIGAPDTWKWWAGTKAADADNDGMPDWWETENGTNPAADDACTVAANGYLNIENYINSISLSRREFFLRQPITPAQKSATTTTMTIEWRDYTEGEEGFALEVSADGTWTEVGRTEANQTEYTITGLTPGTAYQIRLRAFGHNGADEAFSDYTDVCSFLTRPLEVGMVDIDTYEPDVTNTKEVAEGQKLLLTAGKGTNYMYTLLNEIAPASVVVKGEGTVTISGSAIKGEGTSVNRDGDGKLVLNNQNSYTGATVTHGGTIDFANIANGGQPSSLGASQSFAQNWVFDGGTFNYIGESASSDRSARILRDATLSVAEPTTTLSMNGVFEGDGSLTIGGEGTVSVADAGFFGYSGATRLKSGKLYLSDTEKACKAFGSSGKKIILDGGTMQFAYKNEDYQTLSFPVEVEDESEGTLALPSHCYFRSIVTGNGILHLDIPYLRSYLKPNLSLFTGKIIGNGTKSGTILLHETQWSAPKVRFELKGGITMVAWTTNATNVIGGLSGDAGTFLGGSSKQTKGFTCLWQVGGANSDETFNGVINDLPAGLNSAYSGTVSITKEGTGLWRLTGKNVYSGTTIVSAGTLVVNGTHTGTGAVSVLGGATLKGKGSLKGKVTVNNGGILCPGDTLVDNSSITLDGGVTFNTGSTLLIPVAENGEEAVRINAVRVNGNVNISQGANLELDLTRATKHQFRRGDAIPVFENSTIETGSGSFNIIPQTPGEGLEWETSTLLVDGMLRVKNEGEIYEGGAITTQVYDAPLEHTASSQGGANEYGKFLDSETHYYNNWGSGTSWYAQAYSQFTLDIPAGEEVTKAEYTVYVNCSRGTRTFDICYMPAGTPRITSADDIPELTAKVGTQLATYSDITTTYAAKTVECTDAVNEMLAAGQDYILFIMSNGAAGGNIYGKGSATYAPKLTITTRRDPTGIEDVTTTRPATSGDIYDLSGRKLSSVSAAKGIYIRNGKKYVR